jgi:hypothetical protein
MEDGVGGPGCDIVVAFVEAVVVGFGDAIEVVAELAFFACAAAAPDVADTDPVVAGRGDALADVHKGAWISMLSG